MDLVKALICYLQLVQIAVLELAFFVVVPVLMEGMDSDFKMGRRIAVLLVGLSICALTILVEAIYYLCGWLDWGTFFGLEAFKCIFAASCVDFFRKLRNKSFEARDGRRLEYDLWARYEPGVSENAEFLVDPRTMNRQLGAVYPTRLATLIIYLLSVSFLFTVFVSAFGWPLQEDPPTTAAPDSDSPTSTEADEEEM